MVENTNSRTAALIICCPKGETRAARSLVSKALRTVLGQFWKAPRYGHYMSKQEIYREQESPFLTLDDCDPRYLVDMTDAEFAAVCAEIDRLAAEDGWTQAPFDAYHD
ncbi:MAG: hypothetical protein ACPGVG_08765 [Mycobacterium sp.]